MIIIDNEVLAEIINKYHGIVFRVVLGYVKNIHDADDVTQTVFIKLFTSNPVFNTESTGNAIKAWLIRVAINESKDLLKSVWYKKRTELDESLVVPEYEDLGLYEYVKKLKPKYRTVIYLYYYEDFSIKEISEILKISQSTITTQLQRAREQLKEKIQMEEHFYGKIQKIIPCK